MKQPVYSNRPIDFNTLSSREFEEVVYQYFKQQINKGFYSGTYDHVDLSAGVGEKGADVLLFREGVVKGIVQCKKYKSNLGINTILPEILKFLLYHILETKTTKNGTSSLINNIDDFTYFIVVSKDFTQNAKIFLANFNENWKNQNLKSLLKITLQGKSFENLEINEVQTKLENLLSQLNVVSINAVDLDLSIRLNPEVMNRYFTPLDPTQRFTVSNETLEVAEPKSLSKVELSNKAESISRDITRVKTFFGKNEKLAIQRDEVKQIIQWVDKKLKEDESNIAVVAGNAGMGKSVVMSQLYKSLLQKNIPTLSLKADRLAFKTIKELEEEMDLEVTFKSFFSQLIDNKSQGVLLIDQIDALSQALSSDLRPLKFYDMLIQKFIGNKRIRIILSSRIYDLNYDPIISNYVGKKTFKIGPLDKDTLLKTLEKAGIEKTAQYSNAFLHLIAVPLHLDVFLKIYSEELNVDEIKSLQDLYSELWRQKILSSGGIIEINVEFKKVARLTFNVASKMYEKQEINIDQRLFEDEYYREINYLKSQGILLGNDNIEFFHQSFFDYAFARNFVNSGIDLIEDIKSRHQGLFIRSKVKQILNYERNADPEKYRFDIISLLEDSRIRYHIKLLVLQQIAFQDEPNLIEQQVFLNQILNSEDLKNSFFSLFLGIGWLQLFIDKKIFTKEIESTVKDNKNQIVRVFSNFKFADDKDTLLIYYQSLNNSPIKDELIIDYLWRIPEIKNKSAIDLAEDLFKRHTNISENYWFYTILNNAVSYFPNWVKENVLSNLKIKRGTDVNDTEDYFISRNHGSELYEKLWDKHPKVAYLLVKAIVKEIIEKRKFEGDSKLIIDSPFLLYDRKNLDLYTRNAQLDRLQNYLEREFKENPEFVKDEVDTFIRSNYVTEIIIGFSVMKEYPREFVNEAYWFFSESGNFLEVYRVNQYLDYLMLAVFGEIYHHLPEHHQKSIDDNVIINFIKDYELRIREEKDGKKVRNKFYGIAKYELLSSIDRNGNIPSKKLNKEFRELKRKFGKVENKEPEGIVVHVNRRTIDANYEKFDNENWKASFRKYNHNNKDFDRWNHPDEFEHGRIFANIISQNPDKFVELVAELIIDKSIPNTYVIKGFEGLKDGKISTDKLYKLFCSIIDSREFHIHNTMSLIWASRYFAENKKAYPKVFKYLKEKVINGDEGKENSNDELMAGINSVKGAAISSVLDYSYSPEHFEFICECLELLIDTSRTSTRTAAIYKMQYILQYGKERVLDLFLKLAKEQTLGILKTSINPLQYLIHHNFEKLIPFFEKAIEVPEASNEIGKLLTIAYCREYVRAESLLNNFLIKNNPNSCIKTAFEFIEHQAKIEKALTIVNRFLSSKNKEIGRIYDGAFHHIKPEIFLEIFEFLKAYVNSQVGMFRAHSFYAYLLKCTNNHPHKCIALASTFDNHFTPDITERRLDNEPLNVIINAYNAIREYNKKGQALEKAMNVFDEILKNDNYRNSSAFKVLKDLDSY